MWPSDGADGHATLGSDALANGNILASASNCHGHEILKHAPHHA